VSDPAPGYPRLRVSHVNLGCPDVPALLAFYQRLLGWEVEESSDDWAVLRNPEGGVGLAFQTEVEHVAPVWPTTGPGEQQMQLHLEIEVDDLAAASAHAEACGAPAAPFQPQDSVRVHLDPVGHPFCLYTD
jgi:catechol 2,3-dioxygenase-like lactoylglutathione lyase family enzyme